MNSKKTDFAVGLFVLIGLIAIVYMALQIGGSRFLGSNAQSVTAIFTNAGGLNSGSNITIAGVKIGSVGTIVLNPETHKAEVELRLDKSKEIVLYEDATAAIKTNGLIGDKYVELYAGTPIDGFELQGEIVDTESAIDIEGLISRFAFGSVSEEESK